MSLVVHRQLGLMCALLACGLPGGRAACASCVSSEDATGLLQLRAPPLPALAPLPRGHDGDGGHPFVEHAEDFAEEVVEEVQRIFASLRSDPSINPHVASDTQAAAHGNCRYNDLGARGCPIRGPQFAVGQSTQVYPGGSTACLDSDAYFFQVVKGRLDKLLIFFQGGGACWNKLSYDAQMCRTKSEAHSLSGILNSSSTANPYWDYTKVVVTYCSGDMHAGNTTQPWGMFGLLGLPQRGYHNAKAAVDWVLGEFPKLESLLVTGVSAGALGTQIWSRTILSQFAGRTDRAAVLADSFMGVLWPERSLHQSTMWLLRRFQLCTTPLIDNHQLERCQNGTILLGEVWMEAMQMFPQVSFASVNSKVDNVQIMFEQAFEITSMLSLPGLMMTPAQYYIGVNRFLEAYNGHSNFMSFLVDGSQHTFIDKEYFYTATPLGADIASASQPLLMHWARDCSNKVQRIAKTVCAGPLESLRNWTFVNSTSYCDESLLHQDTRIG
mmetsp:Transcript_125215/g.400234  ORF Transcript_125215/g.400234 Transcript_125215/m.400234 type:complete len:497 (+) Transcript_125215:62-1552(+)